MGGRGCRKADNDYLHEHLFFHIMLDDFLLLLIGLVQLHVVVAEAVHGKILSNQEALLAKVSRKSRSA